MAHRSAFSVIATLLGLSVVGFTAPSTPQTSTPASREAVVASFDSTARQLSEFNLGPVTRLALDLVVEEAAITMEREGYSADAETIRRRWREAQEFVSLLGLGDHTPLNDTLASIYDMLESRLGRERLEGTILHDIHVMNFAIPVVFQPTGDRRNHDTWDRMEYRTHFTPFAGVVTYWGAYAACTQAVAETPFLKVICKPLSRVAKRIMMERLAPGISDRIYGMAHNGTPVPGMEDMILAGDQELANELEQ